MGVIRGITLTFLLVSFGGALAGCESMENFQFWDTKTKLAGERKPVFPEGVPGVTQGIPPDTPTWGNIMAEGRGLFRVYPHNIFFPGLCLALTVLAVNMLGDGLRDRLDPKLAKRM